MATKVLGDSDCNIKGINMRLIDADKLKKIEEIRKVFPNSTDKLYDMLQLIDEQPTAYDLDSIVKRLEKYAITVNINKNNGVFIEAVLLDDVIRIIGGECMRNAFRDKEEYGCTQCKHSFCIGDGDFYCLEIKKTVIKSFVRTEDYQNCKEAINNRYE